MVLMKCCGVVAADQRVGWTGMIRSRLHNYHTALLLIFPIASVKTRLRS